jgi:hypothetical protein
VIRATRLVVVAAVLLAARAPASDRRAALDALVHAQRPYGGWVFADGPGGRPQACTQIVRSAERLAAPFGLATWDVVVLRSPGTPAAALELLAGGVPERDAEYAAAARHAGDFLAATQLEPGGWFSEMPVSGGAPSWWFEWLAWRTTLDDDVTTGGIRLFLSLWSATRDHRYRVAARSALDLLHEAQLPSGGFPNVWRPAWLRRLHGGSEDLASVNDGTTPLAVETLLMAARVFGDPRHLEAARRAGNWLLAVQQRDPAPGWAQQYDDAGRPAPARLFEPAALATWETRHAIEALLALAEATGERRYCEAAARAVGWLVAVRLRPGCWARYHDLQDGSPVFATENGARVDEGAARPGYSWTGDFGIPSLLVRLGLDEDGRRRGAPVEAPMPLPGDPGACPGGGPHAPVLEGARLHAARAALGRLVPLSGASFCSAAFR